MKTYPMEYRERIIALAEEPSTFVGIAEALRVGSSWVDSIKRLHDAGEALTPKSRANKRKSLAEREGEGIKARVAVYPGTTLHFCGSPADLVHYFV